MPELPEVETIRRDLEKRVLNKKIVEVKIIKKKVIKEPNLFKFKKGLEGERVREILRKAKVLILKLRDDKFLIIHLRISGWLLYGEEDQKARVVFKFSDGKFLNYMDQRLLGELRLRKDFKDLKFIKELGPEPFEFKEEEFKKIVSSKKTKIKVLLMDQTLISGIGNIYAQEALFRARISPLRESSSLSSQEISLLFKSILEVLKEAIKYRGSSVDAYRDTRGREGGMEQRLKVYGRQGKPCFVCKTPIKKITLGGRGTCFCPKCQK